MFTDMGNQNYIKRDYIAERLLIEQTVREHGK